MIEFGPESEIYDEGNSSESLKAFNEKNLWKHLMKKIVVELNHLVVSNGEANSTWNNKNKPSQIC